MLHSSEVLRGHKILTQAIVFVGGVHGAGKTTLARLLAVALSASQITAGTLIRQAANTQTTPTEFGNKAVLDVNANQDLLLRGLALYRHEALGPIVLDGHFTLLDPTGVAVAISTTVFTKIAPIAIVLVESDPKIVHSRLLERDRSAPPLSIVSSLCHSERTHAHAISAELRIPLLAVRGDTSSTEVAAATVPALLPLLSGAQ